MAFIDSAAFTQGVIPGAADIGAALAMAFSRRGDRERRQQELAEKRRLQATQKLLEQDATAEPVPETYNRKTTDAFGNEVSVQDTRLGLQESEDLDTFALGDQAETVRALRAAVANAPDDRAKRKAEKALSEFQADPENAAMLQGAQETRQGFAPTLSRLSQVGASQLPTGQSAQALQQLLLDPSVPPDVRARVEQMIPELMDEHQAAQDPDRVMALQAARQEAMEAGDAATVARLDAALQEYSGALNGVSVMDQLSGTLPPGAPQAFDVHPMFGGNGVMQAIEQSRFLELPLSEQYTQIVGETQRGAPSEVEASVFESAIPPGVTGAERVQAIQEFAQEREAGGNTFTFLDKRRGAREGRKARNDLGTAMIDRLKPAAAEAKGIFRMRANDNKANSWGMYDQARAKATAAGLPPANADFVGAMAMHFGHSPVVSRDIGPLVEVAKARSPVEAMSVMRDKLGLSPMEQRAVAGLMSAYGIGSENMTQVAKDKSEASISEAQRAEAQRKRNAQIVETLSYLAPAGWLDQAGAPMQALGEGLLGLGQEPAASRPQTLPEILGLAQIQGLDQARAQVQAFGEGLLGLDQEPAAPPPQTPAQVMQPAPRGASVLAPGQSPALPSTAPNLRPYPNANG